jgi:hypothetical protein
VLNAVASEAHAEQPEQADAAEPSAEAGATPNSGQDAETAGEALPAQDEPAHDDAAAASDGNGSNGESAQLGHDQAGQDPTNQETQEIALTN